VKITLSLSGTVYAANLKTAAEVSVWSPYRAFFSRGAVSPWIVLFSYGTTNLALFELSIDMDAWRFWHCLYAAQLIG